nr:hypothetical protein [Micromonospora sp. DSM 115978]
QAQVDFLADPSDTNALVIEAVEADANSIWQYSPGIAQYAVDTMKDRGLVSNGENETIGDMDEARVQRMIEILDPIYAGQNKELKADLVPADLFTNEYLDTSIGLS